MLRINTKKATAVGVVAMMSLFGVTACSNGGDTSKADSNGAVTVKMWDYLGQGTPNEAMNEVIKAFEKANPNIKVERKSFAFADLSKSIVQAGVGGDLPDVAIIDNVDTQNYASLGLINDVTSQLGNEKDQFFPGPWSSGQLDGKTYGLPLNSNNLALYYNKDLFEKANAKVPGDWQELATTAKAVSKDGVSGLAISAVKNEQGTFQVLPFVWQTGGDLNNYDKSGAEALSYLYGLIKDGAMSKAVANYSQEDVRNQFVNGKAAMMINGPWEIPNVTKDAKFKWGVAPLPKGKSAATGLGGENVVTFESSKQKDAAVALMKYLTGPEGSKIYCDKSGQLSSRIDNSGKLAFSSDPNMRVFEKQMEVAHARAYGGKYNEISALVQVSIQEALTGGKTPESAAKEAFEKISPLLPKK